MLIDYCDAAWASGTYPTESMNRNVARIIEGEGTHGDGIQRLLRLILQLRTSHCFFETNESHLVAHQDNVSPFPAAKREARCS